MKYRLPFFLFALWSASLSAQIINIPDPNFKFRLTNSFSVDTDGDLIGDADADIDNDGEISQSEADLVIGLDLDTGDISSLQSIEFFTNLRYLNCDYNNLTSLDISQNIFLERLQCRSNDLAGTLDLSLNTNLNYCHANSNELSNILFGINSNLEFIFCSSNNLSSIDISQIPNLKRISIFNNQLNSIDTSNNIFLEDLLCPNNNIDAIDISQNVNLEWLAISSNNLTALDASNNSELTTVECMDNASINEINIKNGNNSALANFFATNNPMLTCIQVDDVNFANNQASWLKDVSTQYSTDCSLLDTNSPTSNFVELFPIPATNYLSVSHKLNISFEVIIYDSNGRVVLNAKAQDGFKRLETENIHSGFYFLEIKDAYGRTLRKKIIRG